MFIAEEPPRTPSTEIQDKVCIGFSLDCETSERRAKRLHSLISLIFDFDGLMFIVFFRIMCSYKKLD